MFVAIDAEGTVLHRSPQFVEDRFVLEFETELAPGRCDLMGPERRSIGIELGLRDYTQKNGFSRVVIGLSGGIDSALTR